MGPSSLIWPSTNNWAGMVRLWTVVSFLVVRTSSVPYCEDALPYDAANTVVSSNFSKIRIGRDCHQINGTTFAALTDLNWRITQTSSRLDEFAIFMTPQNVVIPYVENDVLQFAFGTNNVTGGTESAGVEIVLPYTMLFSELLISATLTALVVEVPYALAVTMQDAKQVAGTAAVMKSTEQINLTVSNSTCTSINVVSYFAQLQISNSQVVADIRGNNVTGDIVGSTGDILIQGNATGLNVEDGANIFVNYGSGCEGVNAASCSPSTSSPQIPRVPCTVPTTAAEVQCDANGGYVVIGGGGTPTTSPVFMPVVPRTSGACVTNLVVSVAVGWSLALWMLLL